MSLHTPIPVQTGRFWACPDNKESPQVLCRDFLKGIAKEKKKEIILSRSVKSDCVDIDCVKFQEDGQCLKQSSLPSKIEEADTRIIPHTHQAALEGFKQFVIRSNVTDVFALLLYYIARFKSVGLKELCL